MNTELRYKFYQTTFMEQNFDFTAVMFSDLGRIWKENINSINNLYSGIGAGMYITWNKNFTGFINIAHSQEAGIQIYVDTEFLF